MFGFLAYILANASGIVVVPGCHIRKDLIGLIDIFESAVISVIEIRMVLLSQLPIGLLDFFLRSSSRHTQNLIVVLSFAERQPKAQS